MAIFLLLQSIGERTDACIKLFVLYFLSEEKRKCNLYVRMGFNKIFFFLLQEMQHIVKSQHIRAEKGKRGPVQIFENR